MRLLIVADERRSRRELAHLFTELGHTVAATSASPTHVGRIRHEPFDAVVADLRARRTDTMKLLREIHRVGPEVPVVLVAASPPSSDPETAAGVGSVRYLSAPVESDSAQEVLTAIEEELPTRLRAEIAANSLTAEQGMVSFLPPPATAAPAHDLGEGRLELGLSEERIQKVLRIDATGAPPNLLARLLVGSYITGQDQVLITARGGLTPAQRKEIHRLVDRTLGMTVVGDTPQVLEVQNFVDAGKHELPRLLHRVAQMLRTEIEVCRAALSEKRLPDLALIDTIEEEVDRFYLLMVRQLLLSSDNPRVARSIDVESHHFQIGYRLVAKVLEVTGDLLQGIGAELRTSLTGLRRLPRPLLHELESRLERLDLLLTRTMDAFDRLSVVDANAALNAIGEALPKDANFVQEVCRRIPNRRVAVSAQKIAYNLDMALEMLVIVNEVTINRCVEPETVAHTGSRVPTRSSRSPSPARGRTRRSGTASPAP